MMRKLWWAIILILGSELWSQNGGLSPGAVEPILTLRNQEIPGGQFLVDQKLKNGRNYRQEIVSYQSQGLKIYGLLTIPLAPRPPKGYPAILFVHGYIPPAQYDTVKSYATYQPPLAKAGFVTFKPDLRGHGRSQGSGNSHFSDDYLKDVLAALAYLKVSPEVDPGRIGYWGHSNGGEAGLRLMVISKDIKAYSLWAGVSGSYQDMLETWNSKISFLRVPNGFTQAYGLPSTNPEFYNPREPFNFLEFLQAPVELQHAQGDKSVPIELSRSLAGALKKAGKKVTLWEYPGDNHNISGNYSQAWARTVKFFQDNL